MLRLSYIPNNPNSICLYITYPPSTTAHHVEPECHDRAKGNLAALCCSLEEDATHPHFEPLRF